MTTRARVRRDLSWPVPETDLQDLDVIEILQGDDGEVLWRVDEQPAAAPQDCREALLKRRHVDEPDTEPGPSPTDDELVVLHRPDTPDVQQAPDIAGLAALLAFMDIPDVPLALQAITPPEEATPRQAVSPEAPGDLDMTTALQLRENLEFVDVPVLHALQAPPEVPFSWRVTSAAAATHVQLTESPRVTARHPIDAPKAGEATVADAWPQVAEFVDRMEFVEPVPEPQMVAVEPTADTDPPAMGSPELPMPDATTVVAAVRRPMVSAAALSAWLVAARARARAHIEPAERLALVGGGMLMGVLFAIVGGTPLPATTHAGGDGQVAAQQSSPAPVDTAAIGANLAPQRLVPASFTVTPHVPPFPITIAAESFPGRGEAAATPSASRPRPPSAPAVLGAIQRYAVAYNRQDARATTAVWPSADRQALVKTFSALQEQRLTLMSCTTAVTGNRATASCYGTRRYRPRVGDSSTRIQQGRWRFGLQRSAGTWLIATVDAP